MPVQVPGRYFATIFVLVQAQVIEPVVLVGVKISVSPVRLESLVYVMVMAPPVPIAIPDTL